MEIQIETTENWKPVVGYEGHYEISDLGRVKSFKRGKIIFLSLYVRSDGGHYGVNLSLNGKIKKVSVHQLVANAFIENPDPINLIVIDHKDGNPKNNLSSNLRWATIRTNCQNQNRKREGRTTSKFLGVSFCKRDNIWLAYIKAPTGRKHLGCYKIEEDAAKAYDRALTEIGLSPVNFTNVHTVTE
ncbi:hypothetical protein FVR03_22750 [Pontibacter qinzhouensis]|uniref:AP2/ERF domain-containing protein n=1 Tax=Pontibacter qinzhouensis TaxID=2603253 RepID=A0A5C8IQ90_9BACT|nr:NUMOD4 domain-containing protein [Pontibacter qinzhouensis]TXK23321.1 hypothetical protein FVR03_22750 [Pontibacter qinzhouensis]